MANIYQATFGKDELLRVSSSTGTAAVPTNGILPTLQGPGGIGPLAAGVYKCNIDTQGLNTVTVHLQPNAATAGGTPTLQAVMLDKTTARTAPAAVTGAAFAAATLQNLTLSGLAGCQTVQLTFTVTTSLDFTSGFAQVTGL